MGEVFGSLFGGNPETETAEAESTVAEDEKTAKKIRSALYATEGGSAGQELAAEEVKKRETLFGN